jgi:hypothetical protein
MNCLVCGSEHHTEEDCGDRTFSMEFDFEFNEATKQIHAHDEDGNPIVVDSYLLVE